MLRRMLGLLMTREFEGYGKGFEVCVTSHH